jgi:hypothetical protein
MWVALAKPTFFLSGKSCGSGVETRLTSIMRKANLRSTVDLIRHAIWVGAMNLVFWKELNPLGPALLGVSLNPPGNFPCA